MKQIKSILINTICIVSLFGLMSCIKEIDLESLRPDPTLVVNCVAITGEPLTVSVSRTWFFTDDHPNVTLGEEELHMPVAEDLSSKNGGSEDVSYMMNRVQEQGGQATFMRVLTHEAGPGHSRIFDIDEQVLPNAVKIFCGVVYDIMH